MKNIYCLLILIISTKLCYTQNLVPNGDFEQFTNCNYSNIGNVPPWLSPTWGTPDYFNPCNFSATFQVPSNFIGFQQAHSGQKYCGLLLWGPNIGPTREYMEVPLISPLIANMCYRFEMYINLANGCEYTTDDFGVYFSDTLISGIIQYAPLSFLSPQITNPSGNYLTDTLNWTLFQGNYIAQGNEQYLVIGNFKNAITSNGIYLYNTTGYYPTDTYMYIDDVSLTPCNNIGINENISELNVNVYPNPIGSNLNISAHNNELIQLTLFDITSRTISVSPFLNSISINTEHLTKGVYIYDVINKSGLHKRGKILKE